MTRNLGESELQGPRQGKCLILNELRQERTKSDANAEEHLDRSIQALRIKKLAFDEPHSADLRQTMKAEPKRAWMGSSI